MSFTAYGLICCPKMRSIVFDNAQYLLNLFVENYEFLFGENSISYNVHNLLHFKEAVEYVRDPVKASSYSFENYLQ